jgi:transposase
VGARGALAAGATPPSYGGRHRTIPDRACFAAIVYMARTSTPWALLPARELGCGSPATVWRRVAEWAAAGVFDQLHLEVLDQLGEQGRLDWSRASVDAMSVRAKRGGTTWAQIRSIVASPGPSCTWDRDLGRWFAFVLVVCAVVCFNRL